MIHSRALAKLVFVLTIIAFASAEQISSRTSNVHPIYDKQTQDPFSPDVNFYSVIGEHESRQRDLTDQSYYQDEPALPVQSSSYGAEWRGKPNPYARNKKQREDDGSSYSYPQPEGMSNQPSPYLSGYERQRPIQQKQYGYGPSGGQKYKGKPKDKDLLWELFEHFFAKKKELEDHIWDFVLHKEKGHKGGNHVGYEYGEPPAGYNHDDKVSKEEVFKKIKFLAWAATVLLIVLGGGIVLAPLAIGKGRRRSLADFLSTNVALPSTEQIAQLAGNVYQAIQHYEQQQQQQQA